jgi:arylsulfate sulfotransferase
MRNVKNICIVLMFLIVLAACGGPADPGAGNFVFAKTVEITPGNISGISSVNFIVHTKPGNMSKDINVTYSFAYLQRAGYVHTDTGIVDVPVFGLYPGYLNKVDVTVTWVDNTSETTPLTIHTAHFISDYNINGIVINKQYENPEVSYLLIDSTPTSPIIMDIDGEVRWQSTLAGEEVLPAYFNGSGFFEGEFNGSKIFTINFIGETIQSAVLSDTRYTNFHHDIESGKQGLIATVGFLDPSDPANVINRPESVLIEITPQGGIINSWDFDEIVGGEITSQGEDPSALVQNGVDWFHMNSAIYSPQDDSIIVSSRENFVLKVDYSTKKIKWIMGNTGKLWYTNYPRSLQPLALSITGLAPIGQHALSIIGDPYHILLFNNGLGNVALPYVGDSRTYSAVSLYEINESQMTANEIWTFDDNQALYSPICGGAFKTASGLYVVDFASTESGNAARIMVIDDSKNIYLDMRIPRRPVDGNSCGTAFRAREISLDNMIIQ